MAMPFLSYTRGVLAHIKTTHKYNLSTVRAQPLLELSGALGDLGTFVPIFVALVSSNQVSAPATLVFSGIANILTGILFGIPLPVQPMKAIAAVAIQKGLSNAEIAGAGFFVAGAVGLLSLAGLLNWFTRVVPVPIVKGIQVGAGLSLMLSAFTNNFAPLLRFGPHVEREAAIMVSTLLLLLFCSLRPGRPFVFIIVIVSILMQFVHFGILGSDLSIPRSVIELWQPKVVVPTGSEFLDGLLTAGLGQLPLTTLNSVLAVMVLAQDLFPTLNWQDKLPSASEIGSSVAMMNLVGLWFQAMPLCHGSGGLAAQYRFGARSGASVIMLGTLKLVLGLCMADWVTLWCQEFSKVGTAMLGVLVFLAGLELAKMGHNVNGKGAQDLWINAAESAQEEPESAHEPSTHSPREPKLRELSDEDGMRRWTIMMVTVGALLGAENDGIGFAAGLIVHWAYIGQDWYRTRHEGHIRLESHD